MNRCDCGRLKHSRATACDNCERLDGKRRADQDVIAVLRDEGGSATSEVLEELLGVHRRYMLRLLARLIREGHVRRYDEGGGESGLLPLFVLLELRAAPRAPLAPAGEGQLAFGRQGFARTCKHKQRVEVRVGSGELLARVCCACLVSFSVAPKVQQGSRTGRPALGGC